MDLFMFRIFNILLFMKKHTKDNLYLHFIINEIQLNTNYNLMNRHIARDHIKLFY